jgi:hypothetical protein
MQHFLDAADNYFKEKCYDQANKCLAMGALIGLQIQTPDTRFINLSDSEVVQLLTFRGSFKDSLIVANAYNKNEHTLWVA